MVAPRPTADFGVVIPAQPEHLHWVRGTVASVRHFMGATPICVLLDGTGSTDDLVETYGVLVLESSDVEPRELRDLSVGSLRVKNTALWASPFETFLLLDADAIVWGDMRAVADFDQFDFLLDLGGREPISSIMDSAAVRRHFPEFDVARHASDFVNTGAYFARRGALDLDRYLEALQVAHRHPGLFSYGDQGLLNFVLFRALDEGSVRVGHRELQVMSGRSSRVELARRFALENGRPKGVGDPVILHWVGSPKPTVRARGDDYFEPMTHFRLAFRRASRGGRSARGDLVRLRLEDLLATDWRGRNLRGRTRWLRRRTRQQLARSKSALRARTPDRVVAALRQRRLP